MSPLALQQQALVAAIWQLPSSAPHASKATNFIAAYATFTSANGLNAYQDHVAMLAPRVLQAAYPVSAQYIGSAGFTAMARAFWRAHPPQQGDLAQWGGELHDFMARSEALTAMPWIADMARVEWALHCAATAADAEPDRASLGLLVSHEPEHLGVQLAPGTQVLHCAWPVAEPIMAQRASGNAGAGNIESDSKRNGEGQCAASATLYSPRAQSQAIVVWREDFAPRLRPCLPGEAPLLTALLQGHSLGAAMEQALELDFSAWLQSAVPDALWIASTPLQTAAHARSDRPPETPHTSH